MATWTFRIEDGDLVPAAGGGFGGGLDVLTHQEKFAQDIRGIMRTNRSGIPQVVGREADPLSVRAFVGGAISQALTRMREVQQRNQRNQRAPDERLLGALRIDVAPTADPRVYNVAVETISEAGAAALTQYLLPTR